MQHSVIHATRGSSQQEACIIRDAATGHWLRFAGRKQVIATDRIHEVADCLREVEHLVEKKRWAAAGFLSYEAAPAFDRALAVRSGDVFPLVYFILCDRPEAVDLPPTTGRIAEMAWKPTVESGAYRTAIEAIHAGIAAGRTYQVNYSYRLRASFAGDPWQLFTSLAAAHRPGYGGYLRGSGWAVLSLSPELFFRLDQDRIHSLPMKGTMARGLTLEADLAQGELLFRSEKDRAENVMIVDMVRNDLARIAQPGTVQADRLFSVQRLPTLWQMTSRVRARTRATLTDIMAALFPAASITGAPKAATMAIIRELETTPRRIYTGTLGYLLPGRQAQFNVAIRTLLASDGGQMEYGVGGGIVADSTVEGEWRETRLKALLCTRQERDFSLLETMLWTREEGYVLLDEHMARLARSADYFLYDVCLDTVTKTLAEKAAAFTGKRCKVRCQVNRFGKVRVESMALEEGEARPMRAMLAARPVDTDHVFLYHKTTCREIYDRLRAELPAGVDEVILHNRRGEITEASFFNIVVSINGIRYTPPVDCGLLAGTLRGHLLASGGLRERIITVDELKAQSGFSLINSVRGEIPCMLV